MAEQPIYEQTYHADGTMTELKVAEGSLLEKEVEARVEKRLGEKQLSRMEERRRRLKNREGARPSIKKIEIEGEEWFIRAVDFEALSRLAMMTPRNERRELVIASEGALTALQTAMLFVCCVNGENDPSHFYDQTEEGWDEVEAFVKSTVPAEVHTNNVLFSEILKQSPEIWPDGAENLEIMEREESDSLPLASSTSPPEKPPTGLSETESTEAPVI